jgi:hypothetical protein
MAFGVLVLMPGGLRADDQLLRYDDDLSDGIKSYGGSGHAIQFAAPADKDWYVDRVDVCASQYGGGYDPANTFVRAYVCDVNMNVLGEGQAPYQSFPYGQKQAWGSIDIPFAPVRGPFIVVVAPGSLQFRGLYVAFDSTDKTPETVHSGTGAPGRPAKPVDQPFDWMIRCHLTDELEAAAEPEETGLVLAADDGSAEDKQSFGGSTGMVVRLDPPAGGGIIDAIRLHGSSYGTGQGADRTAFPLAIRDAEMKPLANAMYPYALFTSDAHWVRVDLLPDVPVKAPFYIVYVGHCAQTDGIYLGIDTSQGAGRSFLGEPGRLTDWNFRLPQDQVNWMIRAELAQP